MLSAVLSQVGRSGLRADGAERSNGISDGEVKLVKFSIAAGLFEALFQNSRLWIHDLLCWRRASINM